MSPRMREARFLHLLKTAQDRKWTELSENELARRLNIVAGARFTLGYFDRQLLVLDVLEKLRVDAELDSLRHSQEMAELAELADKITDS
ncbi:MAG TPA: hypothetical protein VGS11_04520 [Candidatus Bathyarchaeia archaeon]|nr:hypothetical protein [Candidatus Bathyarchaeia archaeon]